MKESFDKIKEYVSLWPMATFYVALLGYIGFYTYSTQNSISFVKPELSIIIGIGIYNLIAILLLYRPGKRNMEPKLIRSYLTTKYLNFLVLNPILIGSLVFLDFQLFVVRKQYKMLSEGKNKPIDYSKLRKKVLNRPRNNMIFDIILVMIIGLLSLFVNGNIFIFFIVIHFISLFFYYLKKELKKNMFIIPFFALFIPILTTKLYLKDINYTIFGLSKEFAKIETKNKKTIKGFVTYKSSEEVIISTDSSKLLIPYKEISMISKIDTMLKPEKGIDMLKKEYCKLINKRP